MVAITRAGAEAVVGLEPLRLQLHRHRRAVGGRRSGARGLVDDATSWRERRALYFDFFEQGGFALLAHRDGELVGYAVVAVVPVFETQMSDTQMPDTWQTGDRIAEIETLSVAPEARGAGSGSAGARRALGVASATRPMTPGESITVECPKCGDHFQDWWRPCANLEQDPELADPGFLDCAGLATCPRCGGSIRLGVLTADGDVWRHR